MFNLASGSSSSSVLSTELVTEFIDESDVSEEGKSHKTSGESRADLETISFLDRLRSPTASDLARKRKVHCNPPTGKRRSSGRHGIQEPKIKPSQRVSEFPDEILTVSAWVGYSIRPVVRPYH